MTLCVNGRPQRVWVGPNDLLLNVLREKLQLTGSKYGCGIGECSACTVLMDGKPVLACLVLAVAAEGRDIRTVEGLQAPDGTLDPLQEAFIDHAAFQCGYCTPGMLMTAKSLLAEIPQPSEDEVRHYLRGNLCRCTGYVSIVRAVLARPKHATQRHKDTVSNLRQPSLRLGVFALCLVFEAMMLPEFELLRPASLDEALELLAQHGSDARPIAGGTNVLVELRDDFAGPPILVDIGRLPELRGIELARDGATVSVGASGDDRRVAEAPADRAARSAARGRRRAVFASPLVRNRATVGGNLVDASPAADTAPPLLALGAEVELASAQGTRCVPLAEFFTGVRKTVRRPDELLTRICWPAVTSACRRVPQVRPAPSRRDFGDQRGRDGRAERRWALASHARHRSRSARSRHGPIRVAGSREAALRERVDAGADCRGRAPGRGAHQPDRRHPRLGRVPAAHHGGDRQAAPVPGRHCAAGCAAGRSAPMKPQVITLDRQRPHALRRA